MAGKVYIVGAGPGDPKLLTLRALELLQAADVVVYDRLVSEAIIRKIPRGVAKTYAGKEPGSDESIQAGINRLMVQEAKAGKAVVRLKGGDPFIFSRGGEEIAFLKEHGVDLEVVPGVTSAIGAPAYAGIPLTYRGMSSSVTIATGHEVQSKRRKLAWRNIAKGSDTLVILMGAANLRALSKALMDAGLPSSTAMAAVRWGTTKKQETLFLTLGEAPAFADQVASPSVLVVGKVVRLAPRLSWHRSKVKSSPGFDALVK